MIYKIKKRHSLYFPGFISHFILNNSMCTTLHTNKNKDNHIIMYLRGKILEKCSFNPIMSKLILNNVQTYFAFVDLVLPFVLFSRELQKNC